MYVCVCVCVTNYCTDFLQTDISVITSCHCIISKYDLG